VVGRLRPAACSRHVPVRRQAAKAERLHASKDWLTAVRTSVFQVAVDR
jgi:hypothetical protein